MSAPFTPKHYVMRFYFTGMGQADAFVKELERLQLPAKLSYEKGWLVITNTRCLGHASELYKLILNQRGGAR